MGKPYIAANQTRGMRTVRNFAITQRGQQETVQLPRGPHIEGVLIEIDINAYTAGLTIASWGFLGTARVLQRVDWAVNGNVTFDTLTGPQLLAHEIVHKVGFGDSANSANWPISAVSESLGAAGRAVFFLDRVALDGMRSKDSYLQTDNGVQSNELKLTFDLLAGATGLAGETLTGSCRVTVFDYQERRSENGTTPAPLYYLKRTGRLETLASGQDQQVKISTGNRLRFISIRPENTAQTASALDNVQRLRLVRAGDTRIDCSASAIRALNERTFNNLLPGQIVIDLATIGASSGVPYSEYWPIPSSADTFLHVDTDAAIKLDITTLEGVDYRT